MNRSKRQISKTVKAFYTTSWAIEPEKLQEILAVLEQRHAGELPIELLSRFAIDDGESGAPQDADTTRIIPLHGLMTKRANLMSQMSGGTSTDIFRSQVQDAAANKSVKAIVIDVDSPGGNVEGLTEAAAAVRQARAQKPVVAVANEKMTSAAYWVGSAADKIVAGPTSQVGSIGVLSVHRDTSAKDEKEGVTQTVFKAGEMKAAGIGPLDEQVRASMQAKVDQAMDLFVQDVMRNRPSLTEAQIRGTEAEVFLGQRAIDAGLADEIGTLDGVVESLSNEVPASAVVAYIP